MERFSIARSLRLALVGLTLVLTLLATLGVASLYSARDRYEEAIVRSAELGVAGANLSSAGIAEEVVFREARGPTGASARAAVGAAYSRAASRAAALARSDPISARLVAAQTAAESQASAAAAAPRSILATAGDRSLARARRLATELQARQAVRQLDARRRSSADSRSAIVVLLVAALLAVLGALGLVTLLVGAMRRPLDALMNATRRLAAGELEGRVKPAGPRELRALGAAFNAMGKELSSAQRGIEEERRRLAVTIESLGDGLIVTDPDSSTIAAVNPRASELVPELGAGGRVADLGSPLPPLDAVLDKEAVVEHLGRTLTVSAAALGTEPSGVVWTVHDMSARARLERAKSDFVATASHELRSPLTSIKGFVELLARTPDNMSERQQEFVDIILRSADRLVELVNDLLDVARIDAEHVEINRRPIDVGEAVREIAELMGPRIAEKRQRLGVYVAGALPPAFADAGRVRQIVANLLTNAHLYTEEGGRLHVGVEADRAWIQIIVEDSGRGMTPEETERVFERFYRGRNGEGAQAGTGLGLPIVKSLVELHDGQIEVDSQPGRGTRFRVLLPCAIPGPESGDPLAAIRGRRVLVVDDERDIGELIAGQLAPLGVDATVITSAHKALVELRTARYDAVTIDVLMPGMDGLELLRRLRADPELSAIPIVFVSVFSGRRELAGEWVVGKPIDADELRNVLAAALKAARSRVLVVGREELQPMLEPALEDLGIEHEWETSGAAAARVCGERRFEVALVDVGIRSPQAVLQALDLRGRRIRRSVILFSDGTAPLPAGIDGLGIDVVGAEQAPRALLDALHGGAQG